jgi:hypothetical protein
MTMKKIIKHVQNKFFLLSMFAMSVVMPAITWAQNPATGTSARCSFVGGADGLKDFFLFPACIINEYLIPIAIGMEVVLFTFGIVQYIANAGNETQRQQGSQFIMWGIIALFVTLSFWAIVGVLQRTLQLG